MPNAGRFLKCHNSKKSISFPIHIYNNFNVDISEEKALCDDVFRKFGKDDFMMMII
jgi:hypothetical protein